MSMTFFQNGDYMETRGTRKDSKVSNFELL